MWSDLIQKWCLHPTHTHTHTHTHPSSLSSSLPQSSAFTHTDSHFLASDLVFMSQRLINLLIPSAVTHWYTPMSHTLPACRCVCVGGGGWHPLDRQWERPLSPICILTPDHPFNFLQRLITVASCRPLCCSLTALWDCACVLGNRNEWQSHTCTLMRALRQQLTSYRLFFYLISQTICDILKGMMRAGGRTSRGALQWQTSK